MMIVNSLKNFENKKIFRSCNIFDDIQRSKHIREPFSEYEILDLQDKFLTNGFHFITVKDINFGRILMNRFLDSLHCYDNKAILTLSNLMVNDSVADLYYELLQGGYVDFEQNNSLWLSSVSKSYGRSERINKDLTEFFIDQFYYNFIWVEACHELVDKPWFADFFDTLKTLKIDQHIPIFVISYCK